MHTITVLNLACLAATAWAWDPATDRARCTENRDLCLTSFIWCNEQRDSAEGCSFPANTYPWYDRDFPANPAGLLLSEAYNITWENNDPDYPVLVEWIFGDDQWPESFNRGTWSSNITNATFLEVTFGSLARDFPTEEVDYSAAQVIGTATSTFNFVRISQPERPPPSTTTIGYQPNIEISDQFRLIDSTVAIFINTQTGIAEDRVDRRWTLGVGIGVGVGVPLLLLAAFAVGWMIGGRRGQRSTTSMSKKSSASS